MGFEIRNLLSVKPIIHVLRKFQHARFSSTLSPDPFSPTTGRWLWNEPRRQQEHTRRFDLKALEHVVIKATGSESAAASVRFEKLAEGASNKVFLAVVGEQRLIVKIPDPVVPPRLVTASEVATLKFLRTELEMPVPKVFTWNDNSDNPVGCEYIIMEEAQGLVLSTLWSGLDIPEKLAVVDEVLSIQKRLTATGDIFSGYGSLYFVDDAEKLGFSQYLPVLSTQPPAYCIGPLAHQHFIDPTLTDSGVNCGPWRTPQDYLVSVICSSMTQIRSQQSRDLDTDRAFSFPTKTASNTTANALSDMLRTLCTAIPHILPQSTYQLLPLLWHKDLHFGNVFVSPKGKITCIVDWQGTDIMPLFLAARIPQFIDVEHDALLLELPDNFSDMPETRRLEVWERYRQSMLQQYYLADLREYVPDLAALFEDQQLAPIRKQVEIYSRISLGEDVDALFLRETLLRIQRDWATFLGDRDIVMPCPIKIEGDELHNHQKDSRRYNEFQDLLKVRNIPVAEGGWVSVDEFAERKQDLKHVVEKTIESLKSQEEQTEFKNRLCHWHLTDWQNT